MSVQITTQLVINRHSLDIVLDALDAMLGALHERDLRAPSPASAHALEAVGDLYDDLWAQRHSHQPA